MLIIRTFIISTEYYYDTMQHGESFPPHKINERNTSQDIKEKKKSIANLFMHSPIKFLILI